MFYDTQGNPVPWVKLDLEVPQRLEKLPDYPLAYVESFDKQFEERNEEENAFVSNLFSKHYTVIPPTN